MKKLMCWALAVLLCLSLLPMGALAEESLPERAVALPAAVAVTAEEPVEEPAAVEPAEAPAVAEVSAPATEEVAAEVLLAAPVASGVCGDDLTWELSAEGVLTITGTGITYEELSVTVLDSWREAIREVVIGEGVTALSFGAFDCCVNLTKVTLPSTLESIRGYAFSNCGLTSFTIPAGVTDVNAHAFEGSAIAAIQVEAGNAAYAAVDGALYTKDLKTFLICPSGMTGTFRIPEGTEVIGEYAFRTAYELDEIYIPATVKTIGNDAFTYSAAQITVAEDSPYFSMEDGVLFNGDKTVLIFCPRDRVGSYTVPSTVKELAESAFDGCGKLTEILLPEGLTTIGWSAFRACRGLTEIAIPSTVTELSGYAFELCSGLLQVSIPSGVTEIPYECFSNCTSMQSVAIPATVKEISGLAFAYCENLTHVSYEGTEAQWNEITIDERENNYLLNASFAFGTMELPEPEELPGTGLPASGTWGDSFAWEINEHGHLYLYGEGTMPNADYAEDGLNVPWNAYIDSVTAVLVEGPSSVGSFVFANYPYLQYVYIGSTVKTVGSYAFNNSPMLAAADLYEGLTAIGDYAFSYCDALTEIAFPSTLESLGEGAFGSCANLTKIIVPAGLTEIGAMAFSETALATVCYAGTEGQWKKISVGANNEPLLGANILCNSTDSGTLGDVDWTLNTDGTLSFGGDGAVDDTVWEDHAGTITDIVVSEGVTAVGENTFSGMEKLTSVEIPDSVATIGAGAFRDSAELDFVVLGSGLESIGDNAFEGCKLGEVYFTGTREELEAIAGDNNAALLEAAVCIQQGNVDGQGDIDAIDLARMMKDVSGADVKMCCSGDMNADRTTNILDVIGLAQTVSNG